MFKNLLASTLLSLWVCAVYPVCNLAITHDGTMHWSPSGDGNYRVFNDIEEEQKIDGINGNFHITYDSGDDCKYFVTFSRGGASDYSRLLSNGGNQLSYQLYTAANLSNILMEVPDASSANILSGVILDEGPPREIAQSYHWVIPPQQIVPPGVYTDNINLIVYEGRLNNYTESGIQTVTFSATVPRATQVSLGDSGGAFDDSSVKRIVNFGELSQGDTRTFDLRVRSNAGYRLKLESANSGYLIHERAQNRNPMPEAYKVPYSVKSNNGNIHLSSGGFQTVGIETEITSDQGNLYTLELEIGDVSKKFEGPYSDIIHVVAESLN